MWGDFADGISVATLLGREDADRAERWLRLAGCEKIFRVSSYTGEGIWQLLEYLRGPGDVLPWDSEKKANHSRKVLSTKANDSCSVTGDQNWED